MTSQQAGQGPGGGGGVPWAVAAPALTNIHYWKQQQQQQVRGWCDAVDPVSAVAADGGLAAPQPGSPAELANFVTTVTVPSGGDWPSCSGGGGGGAAPVTPGSPRCESARSDAADSSCSSLSQESLSPPAARSNASLTAGQGGFPAPATAGAAEQTLAGVRSVTAPPRWNRVTSNGHVVYVSPSGVSLTSVDEARLYLRTDGTCKCGLECPLILEKSFNFDPKVITRPWSSSGGSVSPSETTKTCNHRRKRAHLLPHRASRKDVPPTFQEQRCNPHNNRLFKEQMRQAMESLQQQQHQQQQLSERLSQQTQQQHQQQTQQRHPDTLSQHQSQLHLQHQQHLIEQQQIMLSSQQQHQQQHIQLEQQLLQQQAAHQNQLNGQGSPHHVQPHQLPHTQSWSRVSASASSSSPVASPLSSRPLGWEELRQRRQQARSSRRRSSRASPCPEEEVHSAPDASRTPSLGCDSPPAACSTPLGTAAPGSMPSFLEDPSGYLAQQVQLMNDTLQERLSPAPPPATQAQTLTQASFLPSQVSCRSDSAVEEVALSPRLSPTLLPAQPEDEGGGAPSPTGTVLTPVPSPSPAPQDVVSPSPPSPPPLPCPVSFSPVPCPSPALESVPEPVASSPPALAEPAASVTSESEAAAKAEPAVEEVVQEVTPMPAPVVVQGAVTSAQHPSTSRGGGQRASPRASAPRTAVTVTSTTTTASARASAAVTRPSSSSTRRAPPPTLAPAPAPQQQQQQQYQVVSGGDLPLMQSLPAGQIILPSGQVILTQPLQPMVQYVNAFPMQGGPLLLPAGGGLLQTVESEVPRPPAPSRRKRRRPAATVASMLRGPAPAPPAPQPGVVGGLPTFLLGGKPASAAPQLVLQQGQPGLSLLQPLLLPNAGGQQLFIQNMASPLISPTFVPVSTTQPAGGQLLQVVSVMGADGTLCPSVTSLSGGVTSLSAGMTTLPLGGSAGGGGAVEPVQTRMPADSSTPAAEGGVSPDPAPPPAGPQCSEMVSSTVEPADGEAGSTPPPPPSHQLRVTGLKRKRCSGEVPEAGFAVGDLVWGSNQGLDSWPGQVIQRTDVQPCPPGRLWVRWFGDHTMSLQAAARLRRFHTHNTAKHKKSHAVNSSFEEALQEALLACDGQHK